ncbi:hypothetical protein KY290_010322 [Solanum tuberosum]|uniref:Uncharacterized protein n=1 Tax=Solanum tuberosum TaxID=4113 RepID=A0ABQ7VXG5_SOLTU|nr:hypothetical protein KY290_010322 [Solanum tuberosum]
MKGIVRKKLEMLMGYFKDSNFLRRRKFDITCFENSYARDFVKYAAEQFGRDHQEIANEVSLGTVSAGTDCDSFEKEEGNNPASIDYYSEEFKVFRRERTKEINEKLDKYKELEKGMTCKDIQNLEELYAIANDQRYEGDREGEFKLNVSKSKLKRVKRFVLEKLEGSYLDDYNRFEAYAQELRESNLDSDVVINISEEALAKGKRRFLRMYVCFQAMKHGFEDGVETISRAGWHITSI